MHKLIFRGEGEGARTHAVFAAPAFRQTDTPRLTGCEEHMASADANAMSVNTDAAT
jgi:hypothetical protein